MDAVTAVDSQRVSTHLGGVLLLGAKSSTRASVREPDKAADSTSSELGTASKEVIMAMRGVGKATRATYKAGELEFVSKRPSEVNTIYQLKYTLPRPQRRPRV